MGARYTGDDTTSILPSGSVDQNGRRKPIAWHGGLDFGLLVLRIVAGGIIAGHGLQHLFGWWNGIGVSRFAQVLTDLGYQHGRIFAYITGWTEVISGLFLVIGLLTPLAAAGVLGVMVNAIVAAKGHGLFGPSGFELELLLAGCAFALLFTGSGRIGLDNDRRWFRSAPAFGFLGLLVAAAATVVVLVAFHHR